jgi:hypothetical protein
MLLEKSFFEYLGIADSERIHSQVLAWILSEDCKAIDSKERLSFLKRTFNVSEKIEEIQTEMNRIDVFIKTKTNIIVIENKLKTSQHSNQLETYKLFCKEAFPTFNPNYFFLTLIDEKPRDHDWQCITYLNYYTQLNRISLKKDHTHSSIIQEYKIFLKRLVDVFENFRNNVKDYEMVFRDGNKRKKDKKRTDYKTENEWFIASNQLETIFQKSFLNNIIQKKHLSATVDETRGEALVDFPLQSDIDFDGRKYFTAIELQGKNTKFTFQIQKDEYLKSDKIWIERVISIMESLSKKNHFNYNKLNKPKRLAYVSISKTMNDFYWQMSSDELVAFIESEIKNGMELSKLLTNEFTK